MDFNLHGDNDWPLDFILRDVFHQLSQGIGREWQTFITFLPGWSTQYRAHAVIEHAQEEEKTVANQIRACLLKWSRECPEYVNKANIFLALEKIGMNHLREELQSLTP